MFSYRSESNCNNLVIFMQPIYQKWSQTFEKLMTAFFPFYFLIVCSGYRICQLFYICISRIKFKLLSIIENNYRNGVILVFRMLRAEKEHFFYWIIKCIHVETYLKKIAQTMFFFSSNCIMWMIKWGDVKDKKKINGKFIANKKNRGDHMLGNFFPALNSNTAIFVTFPWWRRMIYLSFQAP